MQMECLVTDLKLRGILLPEVPPTGGSPPATVGQAKPSPGPFTGNRIGLGI